MQAAANCGTSVPKSIAPCTCGVVRMQSGTAQEGRISCVSDLRVRRAGIRCELFGGIYGSFVIMHLEEVALERLRFMSFVASGCKV
jgi:formiminotetrahydrofolate cyclodeaminase